MNNTRKHPNSTIPGNKPEAEMLKICFGHEEPHKITRSTGYAYLDRFITNADKNSNLHPMPIKDNKEISLTRLILEYSIRKNPAVDQPVR